ncbi:MAG: hypothetical protein M1608_03470 [Candidatus Omnitrophica bacterium]|nr:hypothetical protein [Candidatus Omnitrophota bacterium]
MKPQLQNSLPPSSPAPSRPRRCWLLWWWSGLGLAAVLISCGTVSQTVMAPPQIPGATYVGSDVCATCHDKISESFATADHARLQALGTNAIDMGCESCHGPGSLHVDTVGGRNTIINPRKSPETCFKCHLAQRGQFNLPYHHPVLEERINCADCHDPHKGRAVKGGSTSLEGQNDVCFKCHTQQRGPFVFEHEALREGCTYCHNPHGSINPKLLKVRNANLCLQCHFQRQTASGQVLIGGVLHSGVTGPGTGFLSRGTCWSAGCHEAVHGSQVSPSIRF